MSPSCFERTSSGNCSGFLRSRTTHRCTFLDRRRRQCAVRDLRSPAAEWLRPGRPIVEVQGALAVLVKSWQIRVYCSKMRNSERSSFRREYVTCGAGLTACKRKGMNRIVTRVSFSRRRGLAERRRYPRRYAPSCTTICEELVRRGIDFRPREACRSASPTQARRSLSPGL